MALQKYWLVILGISLETYKYLVLATIIVSEC